MMSSNLCEPPPQAQHIAIESMIDFIPTNEKNKWIKSTLTNAGIRNGGDKASLHKPKKLLMAKDYSSTSKELIE